MLEERREHRLAAAVGEPVGMKRDRDAAHDGEEGKADPGGNEGGEVRPCGGAALCRQTGERIDDPAEQHRLGERGAGQREIGGRQPGAETRLGAERREHPGVKTKQAHDASIGMLLLMVRTFGHP